MNLAMISMHTSPLAPLGGKETGGMNVYVRELTRELAARGIHIDVFTRNRESATEIKVEKFASNARVVNIPAGRPDQYSKHDLYLHVPDFVEGILHWSQTQGCAYDILHAHYWLSGSTALELQRVWGKRPIIQMFHTLGAMKNRVAHGSYDMETETRIRIEQHLLRTVDRVVASTPRDKQQMVELYAANPARIEIIPPGVDIDLFQPIDRHRARDFVEMPYDDLNVLFVGRLDPVKGIDTWFRAMKRVVQLDPSVRSKMCVCLIGGDLDEEVAPDTEYARLENLKEELGIGDMVTFLGRRSQNTLPYYYSSADVVVMPSRYESFGLAALEAMACGAPVVASDVGGLSFIVRDGETGYLVPEGDSEAMADCLLRLLHDPDTRHRLGANGVLAAREYTWPVIADRIAGLYDTVLHPVRGGQKQNA